MRVRKAVLWSLEASRFGHGVAASAVSVGADCSSWRGVWVAEPKEIIQQHNQALHPTAYSLRSFARASLRRSGFRRRVSLVVLLLRAALLCVILF